MRVAGAGVTLSEAEQQGMLETFAPISTARQIELAATLRQQMWAAAGGAVVWVGEDDDGTCWAREQAPEDDRDAQRGTGEGSAVMTLDDVTPDRNRWTYTVDCRCVNWYGDDIHFYAYTSGLCLGNGGGLLGWGS